MVRALWLAQCFPWQPVMGLEASLEPVEHAKQQVLAAPPDADFVVVPRAGLLAWDPYFLPHSDCGDGSRQPHGAARQQGVSWRAPA